MIWPLQEYFGKCPGWHFLVSAVGNPLQPGQKPPGAVGPVGGGSRRRTLKNATLGIYQNLPVMAILPVTPAPWTNGLWFWGANMATAPGGGRAGGPGEGNATKLSPRPGGARGGGGRVTAFPPRPSPPLPSKYAVPPPSTRYNPSGTTPSSFQVRG